MEERRQELYYTKDGSCKKEIYTWILMMGGVFISYFSRGNIASIENLLYYIGAAATVLGIYCFSEGNSFKLVNLWGKESLIFLGLHGLLGAFFKNYVEKFILQGWNGFLKNFILVGIQMMILTGIACSYRRIIFVFNKERR